MLAKNTKTLSIIAESINVVAALIGIFGFLTGISTLPSLLSSKGSEQTNTTWFFSTIPPSISIPVFIITLVFVYGLYFVVVYKANRWLFSRGLIRRWKPPHVIGLREAYGGRPGDLFSIVVFTSLGSAIGWLIFDAFFGLPVIDDPAGLTLFITMVIPGIVALVCWLCIVAKNSASID